MKTLFRVLSGWVFMALLPAPGLRGGEPPLVATLHPLLSEWVSGLAGDAVRVECLMPRTEDVHSFDPKPEDMARIREAVLVVAMGKHLEVYLDRLAENLSPGVEIYEAGRRVPSVKIDPGQEMFACCPRHTHGAIDPHWWHSPVAVRRAVRHLGRELEDLLPDHRDAIRERTRAKMEDLERLHEWADSALAEIPSDKRKLVTAHAAFGYFCVEYDFKAVPVKGLTADRNPSPEDLATTLKTIEERRIEVVFPETKVNESSLVALTQTAGVRIAEPLIADFLGHGAHTTYEEMFRANVKNIVSSILGGNADGS